MDDLEQDNTVEKTSKKKMRKATRRVIAVALALLFRL